MTRQELSEAQFLFNTWEHASKLADQYGPKRRLDDRMEREFASIARHAGQAFYELTGRFVWNVRSIVELSTENPAAWTLLPYLDRWDSLHA